MVEEDDNVVVLSVDLKVALQPQSGRTESSTVWTLELRRCCCDSVCFVVTGNGKALASFISLLQTVLQPFGTSCAVPPCCWRYFHKRFLGCLFCSAPSCSEACLFFSDDLRLCFNLFSMILSMTLLWWLMRLIVHSSDTAVGCLSWEL